MGDQGLLKVPLVVLYLKFLRVILKMYIAYCSREKNPKLIDTVGCATSGSDMEGDWVIFPVHSESVFLEYVWYGNRMLPLLLTILDVLLT